LVKEKKTDNMEGKGKRGLEKRRKEGGVEFRIK
jgi:hypothetical protein